MLVLISDHFTFILTTCNNSTWYARADRWSHLWSDICCSRCAVMVGSLSSSQLPWAVPVVGGLLSRFLGRIVALLRRSELQAIRRGESSTRCRMPEDDAFDRSRNFEVINGSYKIPGWFDWYLMTMAYKHLISTVCVTTACIYPVIFLCPVVAAIKGSENGQHMARLFLPMFPAMSELNSVLLMMAF